MILRPDGTSSFWSGPKANLDLIGFEKNSFYLTAIEIVSFFSVAEIIHQHLGC